MTKIETPTISTAKEYRDSNASLAKSNSSGHFCRDTRYALTYLRLSLEYYRMNGRTPDTVAALKRALEKFELVRGGT